MKSPTISYLNSRIGLYAFSTLALLALAAAFFMFISDDFVIRGQVVPASDATMVLWRNCLGLAGVCFGALAWLCCRGRS